MSGIGESIATDAAKGAVCWLAGEARYCYDFDTYIKDFREAKDELESTIESVQARAKRANVKTEEVGGHVVKALGKALALKQKAEKLDQEVKNKRHCFGQCPNLICKYFLGRRAEELTSLMNVQNGKLKGSTKFAQLKSLKHRQTSENYFDSESAKLAYKKLWEALTKFNKIGLYGMGGCGKTTLLRKLAEEVQNSNLFQKVTYTVVSYHPNIINIQGSIASWLSLKFDPGEGEPERATRLSMSLSSVESILIILDDVWQKLDYEKIGIPSGPNHKNCTILITTRSKQVCTRMDCETDINLELLNEDEAWNLFKKHAGIVNEDPESQRSAQAREISKKCKGLPIAVAAVASSLKGKTPGDWEKTLQKFRDREPVDVEDEEIDPYNCLQSSYDNLKDNKEAKDLFLLCSLFPEDSEIQLEDLIRSGTGLGIFGKSDSYGTVRSNVDSIINKLICSSMLLQGNKGQSVIMHDLVRSTALRIAKKEIQVIMGSGKDLKASAEDKTTEDIIRYLYCHNIDEFPTQLDFPKLEILFVFQDRNCSSKVSDTFFKGMKGLKVLTVTDRSLQQTSTLLLPPSVKVLTNLRTLCLKGCRLDKIDFLENLEKLETLEFCECTISELSNQIAKLQKLRLLEVSQCRIGGNPYEVLGSCFHLQELYFLENRLSETLLNNHNLAGFFDKKKDSPPKLQRYHLQIGSYIDNIKGNNEMRSKILSISHFLAINSNATINDLVQESEILFLKNILGGCKSIVPDIVQTRGMNALNELLLRESDEIECVIDATSNLCEVGTIFSKLNKLRITRMKCLVALCRGQPPRDLFQKLEEMQISKCSQMHGVLFVGVLNLHNLNVLELNECPRLTSLFTHAIAQSLVLLQVIKITNCNDLKHIIAEEQEEILSIGNAVFPMLERLFVTDCQQLEYLIPLSLAQGLQHLESLLIYQAPNLKYLFGKYTREDQLSYQRHNKPQIIEFAHLKQLELVDLPSIISVCSKNHYPSWHSLQKPYVRGCPDSFMTTLTQMGGSESEEQQQYDHNSKKQGCRNALRRLTRWNLSKVKAGINIGTAAAASVARDLVDLTAGQVYCCLRFNYSIEDLTEEKKRLNLVMLSIENAKYKGEKITDDVKTWLEEANKAINEVEELEEKMKRRKRWLRWIWRSNLHKKRDEMKLLEINGGCFETSLATIPPIIEYGHSDNLMSFNSTKLAYDKLRDAVMDDQVSMIGLYGMGGCGKTTLVKMLAREVRGYHLVESAVMATVGMLPNIRRIQDEIADQLGLRLAEESAIGRSQRLSMRLLHERGTLIILDDVWTKLDLEAIGIPFGRLHYSCVLLTTRRLQVCNLMDCQRTIPLSPLTEEEAWTLFVKHADLTDDSPTMMHLAREIAKACAGLPLAIVNVARSLRGTTRANWEEALDTLTGSRFIDFDEDLTMPYLSFRLSYDYLRSAEAKSLFLFCSAFPGNYGIPIEILIRYGIGLCFGEEYESLDLARRRLLRALDMLVDSSLLEYDGTGCVKMLGLVRGAALWIANQEEFNSGRKYLWCDRENNFPHQLDFRKITFLYIQKDSEHAQLDEFLELMEELRVLVLRNEFAGIISALRMSNSIEGLKNLRCLVLDGWELGDLYFIGSLRRLEALTFQHCSFEKLPSGLVQLTKLKLLDLSECKIEREPYEVIGRCSQLEELYFTRCHNSEWKFQGDNSAELFHKNGNRSLKRYHIEVGETIGLFDRVDYSVSRCLSVQYFDALNSDATTNDLIQRAEVLFLKDIKGACKNIIPGIVQTRGMGEVIELLVCNSAEIECLFDSTSSLVRATVFSKLLKLTIESMKQMEFLCRGQPSFDLFARLEELHMKSCYQIRGILSAGKLNLNKLKVLELHDCPILISLFTPAIAQTLVLLEVLKVTKCNGLKCIVAVEEEENKHEIVSLEQNSHGLEFSKLKQIVIQNCKQLEYVFGEYNREDQSSNQKGKKAKKIIELPVLDQLRLEQLPNMVGIFAENYNIHWPALHDFYLSDCPQLIMGAINNCTVGAELRQQGNRTTKDAMFIENLGSLTVKNIQVESIFDLDGLPTDGEQLTSALTSLDLYLLPELRYICRGPKHFLSLQKLEELQIEGCGKLKFVFSTSIIRCLSNLKILKIVNCQELVQITEENVKNQDQVSNHGFQDVCFPKLIILFVSNCNKLERLVSISTSHEFFKLKSLIIMGALELKEVFEREKGQEYEDVDLVLPNLEHLILTELPRLTLVFQGIQLKNVDYRLVHECPELELPSNLTIDDLRQEREGEDNESVEYSRGPCGKLFQLLQTIGYNKDSTPEISSHYQMDPNDQKLVQASPEIPTVETSSTDSKLTSPLAVPLHETPSPLQQQKNLLNSRVNKG